MYDETEKIFVMLSSFRHDDMTKKKGYDDHFRHILVMLQLSERNCRCLLQWQFCA